MLHRDIEVSVLLNAVSSTQKSAWLIVDTEIVFE